MALELFSSAVGSSTAVATQRKWSRDWGWREWRV